VSDKHQIGLSKGVFDYMNPNSVW